MAREPAKTFRDLEVWKKAHQLVLSIYRYSERFPRKEIYCLTPQIRRSAISVPANIAEGFKKRSKLDKIRIKNIAQGSLEEIRYYLILAGDLGYGDSVALLEETDVVGRMLDGYIASIQHSL
jgi:four helix bundle protein